MKAQPLTIKPSYLFSPLKSWFSFEIAPHLRICEKEQLLSPTDNVHILRKTIPGFEFKKDRPTSNEGPGVGLDSGGSTPTASRSSDAMPLTRKTVNCQGGL